jgi:hypothetical protein
MDPDGTARTEAFEPARCPAAWKQSGLAKSFPVPHRVSGNGTLVQCTEMFGPRRGVEVSDSAVSVPRVESPTNGQPIAAPISVAPQLQGPVGVYMNCQVRAFLVLRRNCFGVVGPEPPYIDYTAPVSARRCALIHGRVIRPKKTFGQGRWGNPLVSKARGFCDNAPHATLL